MAHARVEAVTTPLRRPFVTALGSRTHTVNVGLTADDIEMCRSKAELMGVPWHYLEVEQEFVDKFIKATKKLKIGYGNDEGITMGPAVSEGQLQTDLDYIEIGKKEGKLLAGGERFGHKGYFIKPTLFSNIKPQDRMAQEEIFGPVLAVIKSNNFDDALKIANNTRYGLTGAVYTNNRLKLEKAKKELLIGNLYFNRKCTGALVGGHPFGGFNMSGTDSKAGGRDYLLLFLQAKLMSEKIK